MAAEPIRAAEPAEAIPAVATPAVAIPARAAAEPRAEVPLAEPEVRTRVRAAAQTLARPAAARAAELTVAATTST